MPLKQIPLRQLVHAPDDQAVRAIDPKWVAELKPSLKRDGVLQPLLASEAPGNGNRKHPKFQIHNGRHRLAGLMELAAAGELDRDTKIPVDVRPEHIARELTVVATILNKPLSPVEQWRAFAQLEDVHGMRPDDIAAHFAWDRRKLAQMQALGRLHPFILRAFEAGQIGLAAAQAYTTERSGPKQWKLFNQLRETERHDKAEVIKRTLGETRIHPDVAIFDLAAAKIAVDQDLFGDDRWIVDTKRFWVAQNDAAIARGEALKLDGWGEVQVVESDHDPFAMGRGLALVAQARVKRLTKAQRGFGRAIVHVAPDGKVTEALYIMQNAPAEKAHHRDTETEGEGTERPGAIGAVDVQKDDIATDSPATAAAVAKAGDEKTARDASAEAPTGAKGEKSPWPAKVRSELRTIKSLMLQHALMSAGADAYVLGIVVAILVQRGRQALEPHPCRRAFDPRHPLHGSPVAVAVREADERAWEHLRHYVPDDIADAGALRPQQRAELIMDLPRDADAAQDVMAALAAATVGYEPGAFGGVQGPHADDGWLDALGAQLGIEPHKWWRPSREWLADLPKATVALIATEIFPDGNVDGHDKAWLTELVARQITDPASHPDPQVVARARTWVPEPLRFGPWPAAEGATAIGAGRPLPKAAE